MSAPDGLARMAAATLLASFAGPEVPAWLRRRVDEGLGGVCLFGSNLRSQIASGAGPSADAGAAVTLPAAGPADAGVRAAANVSGALHAVRPSVVVALDEEGGDVTRLEAHAGSSVPGNAALGAVDDPALTRRLAHGLGLRLVEAGVDLDLAPCADANTDPANPVIGVRSFGADPALVARHTAAFAEGLQSAGAAACAKHFPGHGATTVDSHLDLPVVEAPAGVLRSRELVPFQAAITAGVATVMLGHLRMPAFDDRPATLSRRIATGLLRDELGFRGAVVTDALDMHGIGGPSAIPANVVRAVAAGADLCCLGSEGTDDLIVACIDALVGAVRHGALDEARLADAAARVAAIPRRSGAEPAIDASSTTPSASAPAGPTGGAGGAGGGAASVGPSVSGGPQAARPSAAPRATRAAPTAVTVGPTATDLPAFAAPSQREPGVEAARRALHIHGELPAPVGPAHVVELRSVPNIAAGVVPWGVAVPLAALQPDTTSEQLDPSVQAAPRPPSGDDIHGRVGSDGLRPETTGRSASGSAASTDPVPGVLARAKGRRLVVVVRDGRRPDTARLVAALVAARPDAVVVDMGWPSGITAGRAGVHVSTYGASRASAEAVARLLAGRDAPASVVAASREGRSPRG